MIDQSRREILAVAAALTALPGGVALAQTAPAAAKAAADTGIPKTWDLSELYKDAAAWTSEQGAVKAALPGLTRFKGHLGDSAAALKEALTVVSRLNKRLDRLGVYANLLGDADLQVGVNQERRQLATSLGADFGEATAWMQPELLQVGEAKIRSFLAADPGLAIFKFQLENVLRRAPHTLGAEAEAVLAAASAPLSGPQSIRDQLNESDIPWPSIKLKSGKTIRLDSSGYTEAREAPDRADRKKVMELFFGEYGSFKTSLGAAMSSYVQGNIFNAKQRKYPNALSSALSGDNIPEAVYRTLIAETNAGLPALHRYFKVRQKVMNLPDMHYYDIYPPAVKLDRQFSVDESRTLTLDAIKPLGPDYVDMLAKSTASPWADYYPRKGKASGAYMNGSAYDVHPYLLLNLTGNYDSMSTFAHEWGHAMHTMLTTKNQPYETSNYSIFIAEIASTLNEQLLARRMHDTARNNQEKLFYLFATLELLRGTFFRQAMFGEFELSMHETVEKGGALSGEKLSTMYLALLKKYHGDAVIIDDIDAHEWAYIPHFYYDFYVYQYATCISASAYFDADIAARGQVAVTNYLNVLKAGASDYPYEILKRAGLDMASPAPYRALVAKFTKTLDEVEMLLAQSPASAAHPAVKAKPGATSKPKAPKAK
jgi:oligoendopeptidase F